MKAKYHKVPKDDKGIPRPELLSTFKQVERMLFFLQQQGWSLLMESPLACCYCLANKQGDTMYMNYSGVTFIPKESLNG
jgi:hypothetical protein